MAATKSVHSEKDRAFRNIIKCCDLTLTEIAKRTHTTRQTIAHWRDACHTMSIGDFRYVVDAIGMSDEEIIKTIRGK